MANKKVPLSRILDFPTAIGMISTAMEKSEKDGKYTRNGWKNGCPITESMDSVMRHVTSFYNGEDIDPETGVSNLALAATNLFFMIENYNYYGEKIDDRNKE